MKLPKKAMNLRLKHRNLLTQKYIMAMLKLVLCKHFEQHVINKISISTPTYILSISIKPCLIRFGFEFV